MKYYYPKDIYHYGTGGQKWGTRLYQDKSGRRTEAGKIRYKKYYDKDWREKADDDYNSIVGEYEKLTRESEDIQEKQKKKADKIVESANKSYERMQGRKLTEEQVEKLKNTTVKVVKKVASWIGKLITFVLDKTARIHVQ